MKLQCVMDGADGQSFPGQFVVAFEQRVHRAVADGVRGELQAALDGGADHRLEAVLRDEQHAAIRRVGDGVNLAHAPRLPHVGAAGEHPAVEEHLDADDADPVVAGGERMAGDAPDGLLDFGQFALRADAL
jgi:hypothetical protein